MARLLLTSTKYIIRSLERILDTHIEVHGVEHIPKQHPVLFVVNHFTRSETFILPYVIHRYTDRVVRSLADDIVFVGKFGEYLKSLGTLSTKDPDRNDIIVGDLMTGSNDWLIYPEGNMIKNKKITQHKLFFMHLTHGVVPVYTGSAVLALKSELLKKEYEQLLEEGDQAKIDLFHQKYFIEDDREVASTSTAIVPVNVTYYPVRPGENAIKNLVKKFGGELPRRIDEEAEIEGNIILDAHIDIHFCEPIYVDDYIKNTKLFLEKIPFLRSNITTNVLIQKHRFGLTNQFMETIYKHIYINLDHVVGATLHLCKENEIDLEELKERICLNALHIAQKSDYRTHASMEDNIFMLLIEDDHEGFNDILALAIKQGVLSVNKDNMVTIHRHKLEHEPHFHAIRRENTLKVMINEIALMGDLMKLFEKNEKLDRAKMRFELSEALLAKDIDIFERDYEKYYVEDESKPKHIGKPFFLENPDNDVGIILSHGYKAAPEEIHDLADYLHEGGYNVYAVRLKGHGTAAHNLQDISWEDWLASYERGFAAMRLRCKKIILAGFSTGGLLSLLTASRFAPHVDGIVCINAALKIQDIRVRFIPSIHFWNELLTNIVTKVGKKEYVVDEPENAHINYEKNYIKGISELSKLMDACQNALPNVSAPTLIIQAKKDPIVKPKSGQLIYDKIKSEKKELIMPDLAHHVIVLGKGSHTIFSSIRDFIRSIV